MSGEVICKEAQAQALPSPNNTGVVCVQEATTPEQLQALQEDWSRLWMRCTNSTPFQSAAWLANWWLHFGEGRLWVLALHRDGELVAIAPFYIRQTQSGQREVLLLGTGITDYLDVLCAPADIPAVARAVFGHLQDRRCEWDVCDFQQLRAGSPLLGPDCPSQWTNSVTVQEVCPVLALPQKTDELRRAVPGHTLDKLRYYRRRLARLPARIESVRGDNFNWAFESLLELHRARWAARQQTGVLENGPLQKFHRQTAECLLGFGTLRLYILIIRDRLAASVYGFKHGNRTFFYLSGFSPEFAALSPGTLMIGFAMEQAIDEGAVEFDFLRGREAYKYLWGARGNLNYRRRCRHAR